MVYNFSFFFTSIMLGVGLAMDAFSVSLANGLNEPNMHKKRMLGVAGIFSLFQFAMPLIGCGLDRLHWGKVSEMIQVIFKDTDIEILVCKQ